MTRTLNEIKIELETEVKKYNKLLVEGTYKEVSKCDDRCSELVNEYTSNARQLCFEYLKETSNPMFEACKQLYFKSITTKDFKDKKSGTIERKILDRDMKIDLKKLHKEVDGGIGANKDWIYIAEQFNFLMTAKTVTDLKITDPKTGKCVTPKDLHDSYYMNDIAKKIALGKAPTSDANIMKAFTKTIQAMIGEAYTPTKVDYAFLEKIYNKKGKKALQVACANHSYMRSYLMEICHSIIENEMYSVDYKKLKEEQEKTKKTK